VLKGFVFIVITLIKITRTIFEFAILSLELWIFVYTGRYKYGIISSNDFMKIKKILSKKKFNLGYNKGT